MRELVLECFGLFFVVPCGVNEREDSDSLRQLPEEARSFRISGCIGVAGLEIGVGIWCPVPELSISEAPLLV